MKQLMIIALAGVMTTFTGLSSAQSDPYASAKNMQCQQYENLMERVVVQRAKSGMSAQVNMSLWDSERSYANERVLKQITREIHADPQLGEEYMRSGRFMDACMEWVEL